jgi:hypothetical protein
VPDAPPVRRFGGRKSGKSKRIEGPKRIDVDWLIWTLRPGEKSDIRNEQQASRALEAIALSAADRN